MFCKNCGTKLDNDARFCEKCGIMISHQNGCSTTEKQQESAIPEVEPSKENAKVQRIPKNKLLAIICIGVLVISVGAFCFTYFARGRGGNANVYQEVNFNNGARFAYDDTKLYFIANYNKGDKEKSLYSTDHDGNHKTLIADAENIVRIRVINGKIYYYCAKLDDEYSIGSMTTVGNDDHTIVELKNTVEKYDVANGQLYYLTDSMIHSCDLSGENDRILMEDARTFVLDRTMMYYATEDGIYSLNLQNEKHTQLCEAEKPSQLAIEDKELYYSISDDGLYRVSLSGDAVPSRVIQDSSFGQYTFQNDSIYYIHQMSDSTAESIAKMSATDSDLDALVVRLALLGCGSVYRCDKTGGGKEEMESDFSFFCALYTYPGGLYCMHTIFSDPETVAFKE